MLSLSPTSAAPARRIGPVRHTVFRDDAVADLVHERGFVVAPFADDAQLKALDALYLKTHDIRTGAGGLFYSVYSRDLEYRALVDREVREILRPSFERTFRDYDNVINMFVVKAAGPASEFPLHQDTTALDESRYSPLNVWLPLREVTRKDGALAVVPRSHHLASHFRSISFEPQYGKVSNLARRYLEPLEVPAGHAILFDARMLHCSLENRAERERAVTVSGIFPKGSEIVTCYRGPAPGASIELLKQPPGFLLDYPNFLVDCHARPPQGEVVGRVAPQESPAPWSEEEFLDSCRALGIEPRDAMPEPPAERCHMIGEPR